jgi:23S rRNA pseudouridine2605 synthase
MRRRAKRPGYVPLERALSKLGLATRTQARQLILAGEVRVDGVLIEDPLALVWPERVRLEIGGKRVEQAAPFTLALHKPRGVVTTRSDERGRRTVYDFLAGAPPHLVPVGRLDLATSGLLLMTNDTRFSAWVTDPENGIPRRYAVTVRGEVSEETARALERGVEEGGQHLGARSAALRKRSRRESHLWIELDEGKNREVRRLFEAFGHEVTRLKRVAFGGLELGDLEPGQWREVPGEELRAAFPGAPIREA